MKDLLVDRFGPLRRHRLTRAAGRVVLWAAVVLVVGRGVVSLFAGPAAAAAKTASSTSSPGRIGATFPGPDAQALAARFAADYLTYDEANPTDWQHRLAAYGPTLAVGWDGKGHQSVTTVVPAATAAAGPGAATVTVAARTTSRWIYLAVPVVAGPAGPAIGGAPAFVAAPTIGTTPTPAGGDTADPAAADALRPTVEAFLTAWAAGTQPVIAALSADGAQLARADGAATLAGVTALTVERAAPAAVERSAVAVVRWADPQSGASFSQPYRLSLVRVGERWLVHSIGPDLPPATPAVSSPHTPNPKEK